MARQIQRTEQDREDRQHVGRSLSRFQARWIRRRRCEDPLRWKGYSGQSQAEEVADVYENKSSPFWFFIRNLSRRIETQLEKRTAFAWSNICKIGASSDNPSSTLVDDQHLLAVQTLQQEIHELRPHLVIFVSEGFADHIVYETLRTFAGAANDLETHQHLPIKDFYSRAASDEEPAILWLQHPQLKLNEVKELWMAKAIDLLR